MDAFIHEGFWVLVGILVGVGGAYVPLSKSISTLREDAVMKGECKELSELRSKPTEQAILILTNEVSELKTEVKEMRKDQSKIMRFINGRNAQ